MEEKGIEGAYNRNQALTDRVPDQHSDSLTINPSIVSI
jgi:hypothetical protein